jgi:hypothetical protein
MKKATERIRTADLLITDQLLYRLSYGGGSSGPSADFVYAVAGIPLP